MTYDERTRGFDGLHLGDTVRALMPFCVIAGLGRVFLFIENYRLDAPGWVYFVSVVLALGVSGARMVRLEALRPGDPQLLVTRTREVGPVGELVIAGFGAFLLWAGLFAVILTGSTQIWGGVPSDKSISMPEVVLATVMFALPGFFMVYWRPMFVVDLKAKTIRRYPFGRALGLARSFAGSELRIFSEGYWITNTRHRLGDMIRGKVGHSTFELELVHGNLGEAYVAERVAWWARAFDARVATEAECA
ncbi:hypothetical protein OV079_31375 [Nannocystis pusilla]|uniref:Uncharacterized protein n=1 Tax=Nannocystis pusilla TaxID=889268 RepID=A0A9X3IZX6_9BACT|nr:hypothetical protein [Nannocystis pusilla]MCY1009986.1 hypothetical protein [Nannocystis pusilla]